MLRETPYKKNEKKLQKKFKNLSPKFIFLYPTLNFRNNEIGALIGINQLKKLNINNMMKASKFLIGKHDFTSFRSRSCQALTPVKTIDKIDFDMESKKNILTLKIEAKSFLHNQVRIIVGSLIKVGLDIWHPDEIEKILKLKSRGEAGETAPAHGLFLTKVEYPKNLLEPNWPMNLTK